MSRDNTREKGRIRSAFFGNEPDRGFLVCMISIGFDGGGVQGFTFGLPKKSFVPKIRKEICGMFGVNDEESLKGKECYALRCFDGYNELIEGLETMDGLRFTRTGWAWRMGFDQKSVLDDRKESILSTIESCRKRIAREEQSLRTLEKEYVDWER